MLGSVLDLDTGGCGVELEAFLSRARFVVGALPSSNVICCDAADVGSDSAFLLTPV